MFPVIPLEYMGVPAVALISSFPVTNLIQARGGQVFHNLSAKITLNCGKTSLLGWCVQRYSAAGVGHIWGMFFVMVRRQPGCDIV
jgi:hypothetical protein